VSDISEIEQISIFELTKDLIIAIYIVIPISLYVNVINALKVYFINDFWSLRIFLSLFIFFIVSLILVCIENFLIPVLLYKKGYNQINRILNSIQNSIKLIALFVFLVIMFIPVTTDIDKICFSLSSVLLGLGYSSFVYSILYFPLIYIKSVQTTQTESFDIDDITIGK
jgi:hypothetical protein